MANKKLNNEFNVLSNEEIQQCSDIQRAVELLNSENVITEVEPIEHKKFIVEKNKDIKDLSKKSFLEKSDIELDEIANQADQAFYELMDIAINTTGKTIGDVSSAAHNFLNIKLNAKLAKIDSKYKQLNHELQLKKLEVSSKKSNDTSNEYDDDDGIVVIEPN